MTHKESENDSDCQDYCRIENNCCAIADGASQSFYPNLWAKLLVDNFCKNPNINEKNWETWLRDIQSDWLSIVTEKVDLLRDRKTSSWVTNQNRLNSREPATSTFVGLNFELLTDQLKVSIVGDSCLFILENDKLEKTYLLNCSDDFSDRPRYLASYRKDNDFSPDFLTIGIEENIAIESDSSLYFILATDALSEYIFNSREQNIDIFKSLLKVSSKEEFESFVSQARTQKNPRLKNDDISLVILKCENARLGNVNKVTNQLNQPRGKSTSVTAKRLKKSTILNREEHNTDKQKVLAVREKLLSKKPCIRQQRILIGFIGLAFPLVIAMITFNSLARRPENNNKTSNLVTQGETIYKDKELQKVIVSSLKNPAIVSVVEENEKWMKIEKELYAFSSIALVSKDCRYFTICEISIYSGKNIRMFPNSSDDSIFGETESIQTFDRLDFSYDEDWYQFRLVGYIKK